jgi:hypothetical protein
MQKTRQVSGLIRPPFFRFLSLGLAFASLLVLPARAQNNASSSRPDAGYGPIDTSAPSIPPQSIIQQFAAKESEFRAALDDYTYQRDVRVQIINDDGKPDGEYREVVQISYDATGHKVEHVTLAPPNTLDASATPISMSPSDMSDIEHRLPFVLTTEDVGQYNITYVGKQKVDEVDTYIFDVAPKTIEKNHRYFQGRIWVDQKDLQIVVSSGKNVPDDTRPGHEDLSPPFTTYRGQVDGKYWFPIYTKADAMLHFAAGKNFMGEDVHIREIARYTDYKRFRSSIKLIFEGQDVTNKGAQQQSPQSQPHPNQAPSDDTSAAPQ